MKILDVNRGLGHFLLKIVSPSTIIGTIAETRVFNDHRKNTDLTLFSEGSLERSRDCGYLSPTNELWTQEGKIYIK